MSSKSEWICSIVSSVTNNATGKINYGIILIIFISLGAAPRRPSINKCWLCASLRVARRPLQAAWGCMATVAVREVGQQGSRGMRQASEQGSREEARRCGFHMAVHSCVAGRRCLGFLGKNDAGERLHS